MDNPNRMHPMGQPIGTVRATISIIVICAAVLFAGFETYFAHKVPDWFIGVLTSVLTFYFLTRKQEDPPKAQIKPAQTTRSETE